MAYKAPVRDLTFILNEVLEIDRYSNQPGFEDISSDLVGQILEEGAKFAEEVIAPINHSGDKEGCHWDNGVVTGPTGWKEAYQAMVEAGWPALSADPAYGGQGMPAVVSMAFGQFTAGQPGRLLDVPGPDARRLRGHPRQASEELKAKYLPKMATGEWGGTMNLTEPQCGTDLGMMRTKAVPAGRRQLQDHRPEDLDLGRRARLHRQHHPPGARPHRRRAGGHQGPSACSSCRSSSSTPTASLGERNSLPVRRPRSTRWASTATPPASCSTTAPRAG